MRLEEEGSRGEMGSEGDVGGRARHEDEAR